MNALIFLSVFALFSIGTAIKLNKDDLKALKSSWKIVKENSLEIGEKVYLKILDDVAEDGSSYVKMVVNPLLPNLRKLTHKDVFKRNVKTIINDLDKFVFKNLEENISRLEMLKQSFGSKNHEELSQDLMSIESSTLTIFSSFMEEGEIKAWKKLFRLLEN